MHFAWPRSHLAAPLRPLPCSDGPHEGGQLRRLGRSLGNAERRQARLAITGKWQNSPCLVPERANQQSFCKPQFGPAVHGGSGTARPPGPTGPGLGPAFKLHLPRGPEPGAPSGEGSPGPRASRLPRRGRGLCGQLAAPRWDRGWGLHYHVVTHGDQAGSEIIRVHHACLLL